MRSRDEFPFQTSAPPTKSGNGEVKSFQLISSRPDRSVQHCHQAEQKTQPNKIENGYKVRQFETFTIQYPIKSPPMKKRISAYEPYILNSRIDPANLTSCQSWSSTNETNDLVMSTSTTTAPLLLSWEMSNKKLKDLLPNALPHTTSGNNYNAVETTNQFNLDAFIDRLLQSKNEKTSKPVPMKETDIVTLCQAVRSLFLEQPVLLELEGPLKICGDIHGQFTDLLRIFDLCGYPNESNYLFLGDYVDRGKQSLETICLLFAYKMKYPNIFFLLRGNHECQAITRIYGFYDECKRRYNIRLWKTFLDVFNCLPVAAIVEDQIFCCHGGLSQEFFKPEVNTLSSLKRRIREIQRPCEVPEQGLLCDLLWADPWYPEVMTERALRELHGWGPNERGVSYVFAWDVVDEFLDRFKLDLIVRAHQVVEDGFEFYAGRSLVTLFSAPNYCGEFDNAGGIFWLNRTVNYNAKNKQNEVDLEASFQILPPYSEKRRISQLNKKKK